MKFIFKLGVFLMMFPVMTTCQIIGSIISKIKGEPVAFRKEFMEIWKDYLGKDLSWKN